MQFIIEQTNLGKYFCKDHEKVIVFDSEQDAYAFANEFYQFAPAMAMSMMFENPSIMGEVIDSAQKWKVIELPENFEAKTINYDEIRRERG